MLRLTGHVRVDDAAASTVASDEAMVDTRAGTVTGVSAIAATGPMGAIQGGSYTATEKSRDGCHARRCSRRAQGPLSVQGQSWRAEFGIDEVICGSAALGVALAAVSLAAGAQGIATQSNGADGYLRRQRHVREQRLRIDLERLGRGAAGHHPPARRR